MASFRAGHSQVKPGICCTEYILNRLQWQNRQQVVHGRVQPRKPVRTPQLGLVAHQSGILLNFSESRRIARAARHHWPGAEAAHSSTSPPDAVAYVTLLHRRPLKKARYSFHLPHASPARHPLLSSKPHFDSATSTPVRAVTVPGEVERFSDKQRAGRQVRRLPVQAMLKPHLLPLYFPLELSQGRLHALSDALSSCKHAHIPCLLSSLGLADQARNWNLRYGSTKVERKVRSGRKTWQADRCRCRCCAEGGVSRTKASQLESGDLWKEQTGTATSG